MSLKTLEKNIDRIAEEIADKMAYEIGYKIENAYEHIIDEFYSDYEPKYYDRTFSLYTASSAYGDYSRLIVSKKKKDSQISYKVGIYVSSDNILDNPYIDDKDWVFNRAFKEGIHGFSKDDKGSRKFSNIPPKTTPSPKQQMDEWFQEFKKDKNNIQNTYTKVFKEKVKKELRKGRKS